MHRVAEKERRQRAPRKFEMRIDCASSGRTAELRRHQGLSARMGSRVQPAAAARLQRQDGNGQFGRGPRPVPRPRVCRSGFLDGPHGPAGQRLSQVSAPAGDARTGAGRDPVPQDQGRIPRADLRLPEERADPARGSRTCFASRARQRSSARGPTWASTSASCRAPAPTGRSCCMRLFLEEWARMFEVDFT